MHSLALIKKYCYYPKWVPRKAMDERMVDNPIKATDAISRKLERVDYNLFMIKINTLLLN